MLDALARSMPDEARKTDLPRGRKNYTCVVGAIRVQVLLKCKAFYITNVTTVPSELEEDYEVIGCICFRILLFHIASTGLAYWCRDLGNFGNSFGASLGQF